MAIIKIRGVVTLYVSRYSKCRLVSNPALDACVNKILHKHPIDIAFSYNNNCYNELMFRDR